MLLNHRVRDSHFHVGGTTGSGYYVRKRSTELIRVLSSSKWESMLEMGLRVNGPCCSKTWVELGNPPPRRWHGLDKLHQTTKRPH
eukprot:scaffold2296_cov853-Pavlova_lutheri.AAC.6